MAVNMAWGVASEAGRVRPRNEDTFLAAPPVFLVADGMGGHAAGDAASRLAADAFEGLSGCQHLSRSDVVDAVRRANARICAAGRTDASRAGMGTTIAGMALVVLGGDPHWCAFNVGDSRVYRYVHDRLFQISVDHSEVQELLDSGCIDDREAASHPRRNVITRSLGVESAPEPDVWVFPPISGERLLVCSDGLTRELPDDAIAEVLRMERDPEYAARLLVERAVVAGGRDNVTVVVVEVLPAGASEVDASTAPRAIVR